MSAEEGAAAGDEEAEYTLSNSDVCTKYREAGRIAALAMQGIKSSQVGRKCSCIHNK